MCHGKDKVICHCTCFTRHHQQLGEKNKATNEQAHKTKYDDDEVVTSCLHLISLDCYRLLGSLYGNDAFTYHGKTNIDVDILSY